MPADHKIATDERLAKAAVLSEALPFMRRHAGKTVVVKYGGHAMGDATLSSGLFQIRSSNGVQKNSMMLTVGPSPTEAPPPSA